MTGREFFTRFPALYPFLLNQLEEAAATVESDSGHVKLHPSLFLLLLVLSRLYPSPMDGSSSPLGLAPFMPFIIRVWLDRSTLSGTPYVHPVCLIDRLVGRRQMERKVGSRGAFKHGPFGAVNPGSDFFGSSRVSLHQASPIPPDSSSPGVCGRACMRSTAVTPVLFFPLYGNLSSPSLPHSLTFSSSLTRISFLLKGHMTDFCCRDLFSEHATVSVVEIILPVLQNEAQMTRSMPVSSLPLTPTGDGPVSKIIPFQTVISFCKTVDLLTKYVLCIQKMKKKNELVKFESTNFECVGHLLAWELFRFGSFAFAIGERDNKREEDGDLKHEPLHSWTGDVFTQQRQNIKMQLPKRGLECREVCCGMKAKDGMKDEEEGRSVFSSISMYFPSVSVFVCFLPVADVIARGEMTSSVIVEEQLLVGQHLKAHWNHFNRSGVPQTSVDTTRIRLNKPIGQAGTYPARQRTLLSTHASNSPGPQRLVQARSINAAACGAVMSVLFSQMPCSLLSSNNFLFGLLLRRLPLASGLPWLSEKTLRVEPVTE
ncbi:hypothetical protein FQN60_015282, partial [Etheostoma spectabile]